jgi:tyrosinase
MRSSLLLLAASVVSASILPRISKNLPSSAFPKFHTISLEDAHAGKDLPDGFESNSTHASLLSLQGTPTAQTAAAAACAAKPGMRTEWRQYSASDRLAFMTAIKCLMKKPPSGKFSPAANRYEDLVRLHQQFMPNIHNNAKFLVWHRYFLWTYEQVLRAECGFNRNFPWWDETKDAGNFAKSDMFTNTNYFGHLPLPQGGNPVCIASGSFSGLTCHIGPGQSNTAHCLSRGVDESMTSQCNSAFVNTCNARSSYSDMESCIEYG